MHMFKTFSIGFSLLVCLCAHAEGEVSGIVTVLNAAGEDVGDKSGIVVFVEGVDARAESALAAASTRTIASISHKGFAFKPRVLPIVKGMTVDFLNNDGAFHNAFSVSKAKPFDLGIYPQGTSRQISFDQSGLIRIYCNIHPKMISNVLVLNNSFYTTTAADGHFSIGGLPDGDFTLRFWGEFVDEIHEQFSLAAAERVHQSVTVTQRKRFKKHTNKFGKPYRNKY